MTRNWLAHMVSALLGPAPGDPQSPHGAVGGIDVNSSGWWRSAFALNPPHPFGLDALASVPREAFRPGEVVMFSATQNPTDWTPPMGRFGTSEMTRRERFNLERALRPEQEPFKAHVVTIREEEERAWIERNLGDLEHTITGCYS